MLMFRIMTISPQGHDSSWWSANRVTISDAAVRSPPFRIKVVVILDIHVPVCFYVILLFMILWFQSENLCCALYIVPYGGAQGATSYRFLTLRVATWNIYYMRLSLYNTIQKCKVNTSVLQRILLQVTSSITYHISSSVESIQMILQSILICTF